MRKRKIRQWMIEQHRIETRQILPYTYIFGNIHKLAIREGTNYSYFIREKRKWLQSIVTRRCLFLPNQYLHEMISYKPIFRKMYPDKSIYRSV